MSSLRAQPAGGTCAVRHMVVGKHPGSSDDYGLLAASPGSAPHLAAALKRAFLQGWSTESAGSVAPEAFGVFVHEQMLVAAHHHVSEHRDAQRRLIHVSHFAMLPASEAPPQLTPTALLSVVRARLDVATLAGEMPITRLAPPFEDEPSSTGDDQLAARATHQLRTALMDRRPCVLLRSALPDPSAIYAAAMRQLPASLRWSFSYLEASTTIDPTAPFDVVAGCPAGADDREIIDGRPTSGAGRDRTSRSATSARPARAAAPAFTIVGEVDRGPTPLRKEPVTRGPGSTAHIEIADDPSGRPGGPGVNASLPSVGCDGCAASSAELDAALRAMLKALGARDPSVRRTMAEWCAAPAPPADRPLPPSALPPAERPVVIDAPAPPAAAPEPVEAPVRAEDSPGSPSWSFSPPARPTAAANEPSPAPENIASRRRSAWRTAAALTGYILCIVVGYSAGSRGEGETHPTGADVRQAQPSAATPGQDAPPSSSATAAAAPVSVAASAPAAPAATTAPTRAEASASATTKPPRKGGPGGKAKAPARSAATAPAGAEEKRAPGNADDQPKGDPQPSLAPTTRQ